LAEIAAPNDTEPAKPRFLPAAKRLAAPNSAEIAALNDTEPAKTTLFAGR
jgi:hypothetical protein